MHGCSKNRRRGRLGRRRWCLKDVRLSYAELNRRANQLARSLNERWASGRMRGWRSVWSAAWRWWWGCSGYLKAGGAYVPLDPSYPEERLRYMLEDSAACGAAHPGHLEGWDPCRGPGAAAVARLEAEADAERTRTGG